MKVIYELVKKSERRIYYLFISNESVNFGRDLGVLIKTTSVTDFGMH